MNNLMFSIGEQVRIHAPGWPWHDREGDVVGGPNEQKAGTEYVVRVRWPDGKDRRYTLWAWQVRKVEQRKAGAA